MDGSLLEHSDSDSGESWTLLENAPAYAGEAFGDSLQASHGSCTEAHDKDEDTDGISIISDSDPESTTPCELGYDKYLLEESRPTEHTTETVLAKPLPTNSNSDHESVRGEDDFMADSSGKLKTYVHRRNKRLSTVLNIIVLGSVITAAGVAIGHMWGAKYDCSLHTTPSVNKILSNLYKLQEENVYLRNKVKELTLINNMHVQQRKTDPGKLTLKHQKCRKIFEEPLSNKNVDRLTKCVDNNVSADKLLHGELSEYERDFLGDIDKLKNIYQQNKSWLDDEVSRRIKQEEKYSRKYKSHLKSPKSIKINEEHPATINEQANKATVNESQANMETVLNVTELIANSLGNEEDASKNTSEKKVSYADSLKSGQKIVKRETGELSENRSRGYIRKRKIPKEFDDLSINSISEDEVKKDDRYVAHKYKTDKKKNDRHKIHKKQKRRNKYEQWELKGGYMKDYDDLSVTSGQDNDSVMKIPDKNFLSRNFERDNYIKQFADNESSIKSEVDDTKKTKTENHTNKRTKTKCADKNDKESWYEKRATLRNEARKKLEVELFGENSPSSAGWYFRRMQRREQCRIKGDNSTYKRLSKRAMNYKTKH